MGLRDVIVAASPFVYWPLSDSQPFKPAVGSLAFGNPVNQPLFKQEKILVNGAGNGSVGTLNADNSYFDFGVNGLLSAVSGSPTIITFMYAFKVKSGSSTVGNPLWKTINGTVSGLNVSILYAPVRVRAGGRSTTADSFVSAASGTVTEDEWHLAICEWDYTAKTIKIWIDGTLSGSASSVAFGADSFTMGTPTKVDTFGADAGASTAGYNGDFAHAAFWNRALTTPEFNNIVAAWNDTPEFTGAIAESSAIASWRVSARLCATGELVNSIVVTGSSYTLPVSSYDAHTLTIAPEIDYQWSANKPAVSGDFVVPSAPDATPHLWEVTTPGTFGASEPSWNLTGTTTSGTATLTYVAPLEDPITLGPKIPS